ncbi:CDP-glycerol glycerophosphotransferase family protein [Paraburkholderia sp. ZP32-5]|uniref:CDP-glycerol glycerophosphotransferase family protein n=1 Tax=Paraburkholderia sp. ZP32-5 TaxID=2883245 RepID=UPI001F2DE073|nr:CDP-glycerol glycerophosphotransferase family protein [Paraburkholderia sp. ZP32-5]
MNQAPARHRHDSDLLQLIPVTSQSVIEIDCGSGALAHEFKKLNPSCDYFGVDADPAAVALARMQCDGVEVVDLDSASEQFYEQHRSRECWVLGAALARARDPWGILAKIGDVLPENGSIVVSIPNAQHWSIQARLAIGDLRYERGYLDKKQLRWFTRTTMIELFDKAGFDMTDGWPKVGDEPFGEPFLRQVGEMAKLAGSDPDTAIDDAKPRRYVVRITAKPDRQRARPVAERPVQLHGNGLLDDEAFRAEDLKVPKDDYCWAFPVCAFDHSLGGNDRAVFEVVKNDPRIRKIILTRSKAVHVDGVNVEILPLASRAAQDALMRARYIFVKHAPRINVPFPLDAKQHRFINLWHGIPLKRVGYASIDTASHRDHLEAEHVYNHAIIASSKMDQLAMTASFYPLTFHDIWVTGLPRNDHITREETRLPTDFQAQLAQLRKVLDGRRLVLFAPTFRSAQAQSYYAFSDAERQALADCLNAHGAVLGIREHMADNAHSYSQKLCVWGMPTVSLDRGGYPEIELLYREAAALITDYSSCFIDFMLTGRPQISFAYDLERYSTSERGLFYNLDEVFPGPVCTDFKALLTSLDNVLREDRREPDEIYKLKRKMFFEYLDDQSGARVVERVKQEIGG